ncbi:ArsR/SmtB family transcription factor [Pelagibacterium halotolerans]|uniref:ArsR/SmtB family transcription factor n=1 Tax=Pelagibacterium halotolerans TaxID=531813 RepID=UPI00384D0ED6
MDTNDAIDAFSALAQTTRLDIVRALIKAGPDGLTAGAVAEAVAGRQNTVSNHLSILARAGLIEGERDGRTIHYRANFDTAYRLVAFLLEDCCGGRPEVCAPLLSTLSCLQPENAETCCD